MAISATLKIDNSKLLLVNCHYSVRRSHNDLRPDRQAHCDSVELEIDVSDTNSKVFYNWFIDKEVKSGQIVFDLRDISDEGKDMRTLEFEQARCFSLEEHYVENAYRRIKLTIEAEKIVEEGIEFNKQK